jgi:lipopolysaccharide transport system ATP-binding protein
MTAIHFDHVFKAYDLHAGNRTLTSSLRVLTGAGRNPDAFYALSDVSFDVARGEAFGIIGRNGAGKSTLLKIISGITGPSSGEVEVNGVVSSLIELGAGFHPDLTGRENIYLSGAIHGMPRKIVEEKFDDIVDFAELWDFIDVPVKKYSSGMYARLGFAVAVSVEPEILIVDEILSVGDVFFQQKCFARIREIIRQGTTFVYVTHDIGGLQNLCSRALLLDTGRVEFIGATSEAVSRYFAKLGKKSSDVQEGRKKINLSAQGAESCRFTVKEIVEESILPERVGGFGDGKLEILGVRVTNEEGVDSLHVRMERELHFFIVLRSNDAITHPQVGLNLYDRMGNLVFAAGTPQMRIELPQLESSDVIIVMIQLGFTVGPGEYTMSFSASEPSQEQKPNAGHFHDVHPMIGPVTVLADETQVYPFYGIARLPMRLTFSQVQK